MAGILANSASKTMTSGSTSVDASISGYVTGERITLTTYPTGTTYSWGQAIAAGSSEARSDLSAETGASVTFTPDVAGQYVVTCTVDGTTSYVIRMTVSAVAVSTLVDAMRLTPRADSTIQAPGAGQGVAFYNSSTQSALAYKDSSGTVHTVMAGSALSVPADPADDGKVAVALSGDLTYTLVANAHISSDAAIDVSKLATGTEGQVVTVTGGIPAWAAPSGGGSTGGDYMAADANTIHWWKCNETSGSTVADSVGTLDITVAGTENINYFRGRRMGLGKVGLLFAHPLSTNDSGMLTQHAVATDAGGIINPYTTALTLECVVWRPDEWVNPGAASGFSALTYLTRWDGDIFTSNEIGLLRNGSTGVFSASSKVAPTEYLIHATNSYVRPGVVYHVATTVYGTAGASHSLWVNGYEVATDSNPSFNDASMTSILIGNAQYAGSRNVYNWGGMIADVRLSNVARDAAYMRAAAEAAHFWSKVA